MKTKNIFKALAFVILMPAMLLTTACGKETVSDENTDGKGFALPVTVNVTREGDDATKATFNDGTKKLSFSAGDKLLVRGNDNSVGGAGSFAGLLDYDSEKENFSGTIYTQNSYSGTADELFTAATANWVGAALFPNGYESYEFLSTTSSGYSTSYSMSYNKAIAATKVAAVEQFSLETAKTYSSGFALSPENAIFNFTITGLTDGEKAVTLKDGTRTMFTGSVTPSSGTAAFALGAMIKNYMDFPVNLKNLTLTVGDTDIDITDTNKNLEAGKIYNITRAAAPAPDPLTIEAITAGTIVVKSPQNGMQYSLNGGATKVAMTGYTTTNIPVEAGQKVRFYGNGTSITAYGNGHDTSFGGSGDGFTCKVYGNIMSLLDETGYATATTLSSNYVFWALFSGNTALTDASGLLLPATTLTQYCYEVMFSGCSSLTAAPELPATTLVKGCYERMFKGCASLTSVKCLATSGIDTNSSTYNWLDGVSATGTFTKAASATTWPTSSSGIPSGWTVVNAE